MIKRGVGALTGEEGAPPPSDEKTLAREDDLVNMVVTLNSVLVDTHFSLKMFWPRVGNRFLSRMRRFVLRLGRELHGAAYSADIVLRPLVL